LLWYPKNGIIVFFLVQIKFFFLEFSFANSWLLKFSLLLFLISKFWRTNIVHATCKKIYLFYFHVLVPLVFLARFDSFTKKFKLLFYGSFSLNSIFKCLLPPWVIHHVHCTMVKTTKCLTSSKHYKCAMVRINMAHQEPILKMTKVPL
jgi:hypothetical protein